MNVQALPRVAVSQISGSVRAIAAPPHEGSARIVDLAAALTLSGDELLSVAEALSILELAQVDEGTLKLTAAGRVFAQANASERKRLFREHLLEFVPLAAHIRRTVSEQEGHVVPAKHFLSELQRHLPLAEAQRTLRVAAAWGRHAGLFDLDGRRHVFNIPAQPAAKTA